MTSAAQHAILIYTYGGLKMGFMYLADAKAEMTSNGMEMMSITTWKRSLIGKLLLEIEIRGISDVC